MTGQRLETNVRLRGDRFAERMTTAIWHERPSAENPYIAEQCLCHGYDLLELAEKRGFSDVFFLLFNGELPTGEQARLLEALMVCLINPGPRHPATRAGMTAAVSQTDWSHLLPISLSILSGDHLGSGEVTRAAKFMHRHLRDDPEGVARRLLDEFAADAPDGDVHIAPGFGCRYGSVDVMPGKAASMLAKMDAAGPALAWGTAFADLIRTRGQGWLWPGVAAAALSDLGFSVAAAGGLFQLMCAPGMFAHAREMSGQPLTAMPFVDNEHYFIEQD